MEAVTLHDFYSGGYFIIRAGNPSWEQLKTDLLPDKFISLSQCVTRRINVSWGWTPSNRQSALDFGIPGSKLDEFLEWCAGEFKAEMDMWSMFYSPLTAHQFIQRFLPDTTDLHIIGAGLPHELEQLSWQEPNVKVEQDFYGIDKRIEQHLALEQGGTPLGYEIVSFSYGDLGHSWLCGGIDRDMHQLYNIRPNALGLIDRYEEARKVYDWIAEDQMQGGRSEPEPYDAWLLVDYPLIVKN